MRPRLIVVAAVAFGTAGAQQNHSVDPAWLFVPAPVADLAPTFTEAVAGSEIPLEIAFVELPDGVYAPIGIRKPAGGGPFPTIVFAHMNGGLGVRWIREWTQHGSWTLERFLEAGYAVVWMRYRAEVETPYGAPLIEGEWQGRQRFNRGPFEYEDAIAIIEHVKRLPYVDPESVGYMGVSHGGEMLMKIVAEYHGLVAGIATEPAAMDFLARRPPDPRAPPTPPEPETLAVNTPEMQAQAVAAARQRIDAPLALQRIARIRTPIFVQGRDRDHNQATFRLSYELLEQAGKDVEWRSYDHDEHGFVFVERNAAGIYDPDPVQQAAVRDAIAYFDRRLKAPLVRDASNR